MENTDTNELENEPPCDHPIEFIRLDVPPDLPPQTYPVKPGRRVSQSDIQLERCDRKDAEVIAEGFLTIFKESWFAKMEPPSQRPAPEKRKAMLAKRIRPALSEPWMYFIKAIHTPTKKVVGIAGWHSPEAPVQNIWRRTAPNYYDWIRKEGWTDAEVEEMWAQTDINAWEEQLGGDDKKREEFFKGEGHWYLAPLMVWEDYQGRGIGRLLLEWAMERAREDDRRPPLYLEAAPWARAVYMHMGFKPQDQEQKYMLWRAEGTEKGGMEEGIEEVGKNGVGTSISQVPVEVDT